MIDVLQEEGAFRPCICAGLVTVIVEIVSIAARARNAIAAAKQRPLIVLIYTRVVLSFSLSFSNALLKTFKVIIQSFSTHEFFLGNK